MATYPNGIIPWVNRADNVNTIYAADPNTLAAEVQAIEATLGTNPHIETSTPTGKSLSYSSVSARMHDVQMGTQKPSVTLSTADPFYVPYSGNVNTIADVPGYLNAYGLFGADPFGFYNGTDITIPASGWYSFFAMQRAWWASSGHTQMTLFFQFGAEVAADVWNWNFPTNSPGGPWGTHNKMMHVYWEGWVPQGMRVSIYTWNATSQAQMKVGYGRLMANWHHG